MSQSPPILPPSQASEPRPRFTGVRRLSRHHFFGSLFIVLVTTAVISSQVENRDTFATSELSAGVEERWGEPVVQPAPSLRYVRSGTIFTELKPLAFDLQHVDVDAQMNYRKRGLRYFSGFDFQFSALYSVENREPHDIDVAFVFPIELNKSQVLLSDLEFEVNGTAEALDLGEEGNRLVWTGRIPRNNSAKFAIRYRARGLDSFQYRLDPSLAARDVQLRVHVRGGDNYDYPPTALAANEVVVSPDAVALEWKFASLESGVTLGVVLPSEKTYDAIISTMARRGWAPFLAFFAVLTLLGLRSGRTLAFFESYLLAAAFAFTFVLLAYLAAVMSFYLALSLTLLGMGAAVVLFVRRLYGEPATLPTAVLWLSTMVVPSIAVVLTGYTGLIYTLELLAMLLGLMMLATRDSVREWVARLSPPSTSAESLPR